MSDYAAAWLEIYACPPENTEAAWAVVLEHFTGIDWSSWADDETGLALFEQYTDGESRLDICDEIATALEPLGCTFEVWQEAKYEYDGQVVMYAPELGRFDGVQGCSDNLMVKASDIDECIARADQSSEDPYERLSMLVHDLQRESGKTWREHFADLRVAHDEAAT